MVGARRDDVLDVLYISYDGLLKPAGRSQVVSYLNELASKDIHFAVVSLETREDMERPERGALETELASRGVSWTPIVFHEHPRVLATTRNLANAVLSALALARRGCPDVLHARSYLAGIVALAVRTVTGARLVFDMRGFWPEEKVELGSFRPHGSLYRLSKGFESALLRRADHVVVLTENAKAVLRDREATKSLESPGGRWQSITVVPCCVDLDRFQPRAKDMELARQHGLEGKLVIGNIGGFNPRYMTQQMFRFAFHIKVHRPETKFVYLTPHPPARIRESALSAGLTGEDLIVLAVSPSDVPRWLSLFRLGVFFLRPGYAAKASGFTKLGEFLGSGVPVATNTGVGDVDQILTSGKTGLLLPGLTDRVLSSHARSALDFLQGDEVPEPLKVSCRAAALRHFSLNEGVRRYRAVYSSLTTTAPAEVA